MQLTVLQLGDATVWMRHKKTLQCSVTVCMGRHLHLVKLIIDVCWLLQVLSLHADATTAGTLSYANYSHGGYQPHSPAPEDHEPEDADSPSPMSAMLTWAGTSVKQLATKLLGSSSPIAPQQVRQVS